jgi:hypothetical protein
VDRREKSGTLTESRAISFGNLVGLALRAAVAQAAVAAHGPNVVVDEFWVVRDPTGEDRKGSPRITQVARISIPPACVFIRSIRSLSLNMLSGRAHFSSNP